MKLFIVFYLLVGTGILVEILRRLELVSVAVREEERGDKAAGRGRSARTGESDQTGRR